MLHLQQGLVPGYAAQPLGHFTQPNGHLGSFNRFELGVLSPPAITKNYTTTCSTFANSDANEQLITLSPPQTSNGTGGFFEDSDHSSCGIEFSTGYNLEDDSDVSSPPLWKTTTSPVVLLTSTNPTTTIASPLHHIHRLESMIERVPSTHELSLKDVADSPAPSTWKNRRSKSTEAIIIQEDMMISKKMKRRSSRDERRRRGASRNKSMDSRDFLLKIMFLPAAALGTKKRSLGINCTRSKPLPKLDQEMDQKSTVDTEWWKKRFSSSRGSSVNNRTNSSSSSSHDSSTRRYMGGLLPAGCWSFFYTNKNI